MPHNALHRWIIDSATDFAIVATNPNGEVTAWNEGARHILGWTEEEMLGQPVDRFFTPEDRIGRRPQVEMRAALETGTGKDERWHMRKSGERFWANGLMTVLRDDAGTAIGFVKVLRDQTAQRLAAEALRASQEEVRELNRTLEQRVAEATTEREAVEDALRQSQKMEAVGQLTGGLAHDFNNLLTGIMGNLELLQLRVARGRFDDLNRFVAAAQGAGHRAASLTQRLLAFSRRQTLDPKPADINRLIGGLEELIRRTVGPSVQIEVVGAAGLWPVLVDTGQLENALLNLCINARDAMPDGGRLTITTANTLLDGQARRERDLPRGEYLSICVTDTGTGMSPETIARAFEPFFTTKPIGQGTGLGLSMTYGFAKQSGGQVRIDSQLGVGTTMCIYLPRYLGEPGSNALDEVQRTADGASGETVLVVDDEPTIRHLIDEVLGELGYAVLDAADGVGALTVLQSNARVDLLITDVGLPNGMNGRQVADAARVLRPDLKVLFITGYAENAAVGNGNLEPGMGLLTKPFTMEALSIRVSDILKLR